MGRRRIDLAAFHAALNAQGVCNPNHFAFRCPNCRTVQSMALLVAHGVTPDEAETCIGFSCVGRFTTPPKAIGCDWTLGGLFKIHELEVVDAEGGVHPRFEIATPAEAQKLERDMIVKAAQALAEAS
jgi:hypothetical protein